MVSESTAQTATEDEEMASAKVEFVCVENISVGDEIEGDFAPYLDGKVIRIERNTRHMTNVGWFSKVTTVISGRRGDFENTKEVPPAFKLARKVVG